MHEMYIGMLNNAKLTQSQFNAYMD